MLRRLWRVLVYKQHFLPYLILEVFIEVSSHHWSRRVLDHGAWVHRFTVLRIDFVKLCIFYRRLLSQDNVLRICYVVQLTNALLVLYDLSPLLRLEVRSSQIKNTGSLHLLWTFQMNDVANALVPFLRSVLDGRWWAHSVTFRVAAAHLVELSLEIVAFLDQFDVGHCLLEHNVILVRVIVVWLPVCPTHVVAPTHLNATVVVLAQRFALNLPSLDLIIEDLIELESWAGCLAVHMAIDVNFLAFALAGLRLVEAFLVPEKRVWLLSDASWPHDVRCLVAFYP